MAIHLKEDIKPISYIKMNAAEMMKYVIKSDYSHGIHYDFSKPLSKETYKITVEIFDKRILDNIQEKF
ncbi:MAG: hypothetical protein LBK73_07350 [Treponema sp.]|jgi:dimeric dUTPase (all-alpha-NTP-PPase superfamily)|nr:hypothetical protein [Treponema sp.]